MNARLTSFIAAIAATLVASPFVSAPAQAVSATQLAPTSVQAASAQSAAASGEYVVAHPKYSGVCGDDGWTWKSTSYKARHNAPRIMSYRIFTKGDGLCLVVAHAGKAIGAHSPTLAALVTDEDSSVASGNYAYYAKVVMRASCATMTAAVEYDNKATRRTKVCA